MSAEVPVQRIAGSFAPSALSPVYLGILFIATGLWMWFTSPVVACASIPVDCSLPYSVYGLGPPLIWGGVALMIAGVVLAIKGRSAWQMSLALVGAAMILIYLPRWNNLLQASRVVEIAALLELAGEPIVYVASGMLAFLAGAQAYISVRLFRTTLIVLLVPYFLGVLLFTQLSVP